MAEARGILFTDLDGTLVGPDGVAERVWPALARLREAGVRVSVCTGRPGRGAAARYAQRADPEGLHVFEAGAVVMRGTGELVSARTLDPAHATALAELAGHLGATLEAYTADGRHLVRARDALVRQHEALLGVEAEVVRWPPEAPVVRLLWMTPEDGWPALATASEAAMRLVSAHPARSPKMPGVRFVSMTAPGVSKGSGIADVLARLGLSRTHAAMAGDDLNDLDGFDAVDRTFAPTDAAPEVRARATSLIPPSAEGGVAEAAEDLLSRWAPR